MVTWLELAAVADRSGTSTSRRCARRARTLREARAPVRSLQLVEREEPHTKSEFEARVLAFLRRHGLPRPSGITSASCRFVVVDAVYTRHRRRARQGRAYTRAARDAPTVHRDADLQASASVS
jgi:hypothetical protein